MGADSHAASDTAVTVALIADKTFDLDKSPLVSLLEARLSEEPNLVLLERHEIDKILQEQQFSAAGLVRREAVIKVGQLLRADALVLLSTEDGEEAGQNKLLRVRLVETAHGLRLLDTYEQWDTPKLEETAQRITAKI
ncbi:MAG: CsgG/HfaB family protein, partial [Planctomycetota bacterium]